MTGDQAFCANCFRCRNCKKKIENLKYARTSQGIFCMDCHESLMQRRRKKSHKVNSSRRTIDKPASVLLDKSLPSLPPNASKPPDGVPNMPAVLSMDPPSDHSPDHKSGMSFAKSSSRLMNQTFTYLSNSMPNRTLALRSRLPVGLPLSIRPSFAPGIPGLALYKDPVIRRSRPAPWVRNELRVNSPYRMLLVPEEQRNGGPGPIPSCSPFCPLRTLTGQPPLQNCGIPSRKNFLIEKTRSRSWECTTLILS